MATWAIGDVHGCFRSLRALLASPEIAPGDALWFVGDLVNRGPRSLDTLRFVADLGARATVVLGNHDLHFLARAAGVAEPRRRDDLDQLLAAPDREALAGWLARRPLAVSAPERLLLHAGVLPAWDRAEVERRARRAEAALGADPVPYLAAYRPGLAERELPAGVDAETLHDLRVLTLVRTVDAGGCPTYDFTGPLAGLPPGRLAWFDASARRTRGVEIVCGHWAAIGLVSRSDLLGLDTGCAWGGRLTAVRLEDRSVVETGNVD
jgi:bis(5'-nucleosyl)-tetraphosphatase (symmetrical)